MLRTLGMKTLTGTAQPVLGDVTTAAVAMAVSDGPSNNLATITVANTAWYQVGDRVAIDPLLINQDTYRIERIVSSTQMVGFLEGVVGHAHASGAIIQLTNACGNVVVQAVPGNAAIVVIGTNNTVAANLSGTAIFIIEPEAAGTQPNNWQMNPNGGYNTCNTAEAWMIGTAGDKVLVYAWVF